MDKYFQIKSNILKYAESDDDIKRALIRTHELFARITRELAEAEGYEYPAGAEKCARAYLGL